MKVINLFGGPGSGKSTTAAGLFHLLKLNKYDVELVTEYAKEMVWEERSNILDDQLYITAKQNRKLSRLLNHDIDLVVTDSPLILGKYYVSSGYIQNTYYPLINALFNKYNNINYFLNRVKEYNIKGRNQTEDEANKIAQTIRLDFNMNFKIIDGDENAHIKIFEDIQKL